MYSIHVHACTCMFCVCVCVFMCIHEHASVYGVHMCDMHRGICSFTSVHVHNIICTKVV